MAAIPTIREEQNNVLPRPGISPTMRSSDARVMLVEFCRICNIDKVLIYKNGIAFIPVFIFFIRQLIPLAYGAKAFVMVWRAHEKFSCLSRMGMRMF